MPELRLNLVTGEWVIIATERARRPVEFRHEHERQAPPPRLPDCPFCVGQEAPDERFRIPDGKGGWLTRSVPNKFSALAPVGEALRHEAGLKTSVDGVGLHEVIVEAPAHDASMATLPAGHLKEVLATYRARFLDFHRDPRVEHVVIFKNHGERAGASLVHPHSQIVGTPVVPGHVRQRIESALRYYGDFGACLFCRMLANELAEGSRIVAANASFVAFVPWAALTPFHLWIFPRRHLACFGAVMDDELAGLAALLKETLLRLRAGLHDPDFNLIVQSLSPEEEAVRYFHWYVSVVPRVSQTAGFELGTGMFINTALPQESAAFLREASIPRDSA